MSIKKHYYKTKPYVKVSLSLPREAAPKSTNVKVVGDFNDWNEKSNEMSILKNGDFKYEVNLTPGKEYNFRYLIDNTTWENDWKADKYVSSGISDEENSVIVL